MASSGLWKIRGSLFKPLQASPSLWKIRGSLFKPLENSLSLWKFRGSLFKPLENSPSLWKIRGSLFKPFQAFGKFSKPLENPMWPFQAFPSLWKIRGDLCERHRILRRIRIASSLRFHSRSSTLHPLPLLKARQIIESTNPQTSYTRP